MKRLNIIQSLFLLSLLFSITSFANTRTYVGTYPLSAIGLHHDTSKDGIAEYEYIEDFDKGRIYNGKFSLQWPERHYNLSGNFINNLAQGQWVISGKSNKENLDVNLKFTYKKGILNGPCKLIASNATESWVVELNFSDGRIDGDFSITRYIDQNRKEGSLIGKVHKNFPTTTWNYTPFKNNINSSKFRYTGSDPLNPQKIEIREIDERTGDATKTSKTIRRSYNRAISILVSQIIPNFIEDEFRDYLTLTLCLINPLKLRNSHGLDVSSVLTDAKLIETEEFKPSPGVFDSTGPISLDLYTNKQYYKTYDTVEEDPVFPGGEAALLKYVTDNIRYPSIAQENGIQGRVIVQFVVTKTGAIGQVKVVQPNDPNLDNEAIRVVKSIPNFIPGKMNGHTVNVWYTLPITFKLQEAKRKKKFIFF